MNLIPINNNMFNIPLTTIHIYDNDFPTVLNKYHYQNIMSDEELSNTKFNETRQRFILNFNRTL